MSPRDFENLERLKLIIPAFELFTIVGTFVGPLVAPTLWLRFVSLFIAVFVFASACQVRRMAAFVLRLRRTLRRYEGSEGVASMEGHGGAGDEAPLFGSRAPSSSAPAPAEGKVSAPASSYSAKIVENDDDVGSSDATPLRLGVGGGVSSSSSSDPAVARSATPTSTSDPSSDSVAVDVGGFVHAFVIPNYQEPLHVLRSTLGRLAAHPGAPTRYLVTLAMEAGEGGAAAKAAELVAEFGGGTAGSSAPSSSSSFLDLSWTLHPRGVPGESPGKASNANHGARAAVERAAGLGFPAARVMVTCMDADAHVPPLYVALVDAAAAAADDPHARVYAAPIVFERNAAAVPALTRVHDAMWSAMAAQNLGSSLGLGFPISNYTMSASLLRSVGFWDLHDDAIGEDLHMFLKAFFKSGGEGVFFFFLLRERGREKNVFQDPPDSFLTASPLLSTPPPHPLPLATTQTGKVRLCAIAAPLNMLNLQAEGYASTLWARAVQAERHARGVADFSYALNQCLLARGSGVRLPRLHTAVLLLKLAEAQTLPATAPFYMGIAGAWAMLLSKLGVIAPLSASALAAFRLAGYLGAAGALGFAGMAILNEAMRASVRPALFGLPGRGPGASRLRRAAEYPVLVVGMWLFMVFPSLHAAATSALAALSRGRFKQSGYVVAEKLVATSPRGGGSSGSGFSGNGSSSNGFGSSLELAAAGGGASPPPLKPATAPPSLSLSSSPAKAPLRIPEQQHDRPKPAVRELGGVGGGKWGGAPGVGVPAVAATAV